MRATHGNRGWRASASIGLSLHPSWRRRLARQVPLLPKLRVHGVLHRRRSAQRSSHTGRCLRRTNLSRANFLGIRGANAQVGRSPGNHRAHGVMLRALPNSSPRRSTNDRTLDPVWQHTVHFRWLSLGFLASRTRPAHWAVPRRCRLRFKAGWRIGVAFALSCCCRWSPLVPGCVFLRNHSGEQG